jgi:cell division transport system permease protein
VALKVDYFIGETLINLRRNLFMTFTAITVVAVSLFLLGGVLMGGDIVRRLAGTAEDEVEIQIFLRDEATPDQLKEIETSLAQMPEVETNGVTYVSKEDAFEEFKVTFETSPQVTEHVTPDVLPASYRVRLKDPTKVDIVSNRVEGRPGVDEVLFGGDYIKNVLRITGLARVFMLSVSGLILIAAILLISNTIRLAIYSRRKEIGVMKLVGATNWFIRVPFIFEGMVVAAIGAVVAGLGMIGVRVLLDGMQMEIPFLPISVTWTELLQDFAIILAVGLLVGAIGSALALRRFLEV